MSLVLFKKMFFFTICFVILYFEELLPLAGLPEVGAVIGRRKWGWMNGIKRIVFIVN